MNLALLSAFTGLSSCVLSSFPPLYAKTHIQSWKHSHQCPPKQFPQNLSDPGPGQFSLEKIPTFLHSVQMDLKTWHLSSGLLDSGSLKKPKCWILKFFCMFTAHIYTFIKHDDVGWLPLPSQHFLTSTELFVEPPAAVCLLYCLNCCNPSCTACTTPFPPWGKQPSAGSERSSEMQAWIRAKFSFTCCKTGFKEQERLVNSRKYFSILWRKAGGHRDVSSPEPHQELRAETPSSWTLRPKGRYWVSWTKFI